MLQLKNKSPIATEIALFPNEQGVDTLYVMVKATFSLGPAVELAKVQEPVRLVDEYWGEPGASSLKFASEAHLSKPSTDIVLVGTAHASGRKPVTQLDVSLAAAGRTKSIRVIGDREWRPGFWFLPASMSKPKPFRSMPLVYERAFGGSHVVEGRKPLALYEARNPVGRGFVGKRKGRTLKGLPLPNLEDPAALLKHPKSRPTPAGFGFVAASWEPRRSFAGTYDDAWSKNRAPFLPENFDSRFFNAAHPDLVCPRYLTGGERIRATHVSERGPLDFHLPICEPVARVRLAGVEEKPPLHMETVLIEPEESRLSLLWRGAVDCDKRALKVEEIVVELARLQTGGRAA